MIFNVPGHIEMIIAGTKTQTRRVNRGVYQIGKDYAIQRKRGEKAIEGYRIKMLDIYKGTYKNGDIPISKEDANAEGGYTQESYEIAFGKINPRWLSVDGRWVFKFKVIEEGGIEIESFI